MYSYVERARPAFGVVGGLEIYLPKHTCMNEGRVAAKRKTCPTTHHTTWRHHSANLEAHTRDCDVHSHIHSFVARARLGTHEHHLSASCDRYTHTRIASSFSHLSPRTTVHARTPCTMLSSLRAPSSTVASSPRNSRHHQLMNSGAFRTATTTNSKPTRAAAGGSVVAAAKNGGATSEKASRRVTGAGAGGVMIATAAAAEGRQRGVVGGRHERGGQQKQRHGAGRGLLTVTAAVPASAEELEAAQRLTVFATALVFGGFAVGLGLKGEPEPCPACAQRGGEDCIFCDATGRREAPIKVSQRERNDDSIMAGFVIVRPAAVISRTHTRHVRFSPIRI